MEKGSLLWLFGRPALLSTVLSDKKLVILTESESSISVVGETL